MMAQSPSDGNAPDGSTDDGSTDDGSTDDGSTDDGSTDDNTKEKSGKNIIAIAKPTPPIPLYQTATTYQGQPISISLKSSSNPANGVIEYKINSNPNQGKITNFNKNTGQLTYTPNQNAKNFDSFTFSVAYGGQGSGNYQPSSNVATAQPSIIKVATAQPSIIKVATAQPSIIKVATAQPSIIKVATVLIIIKPTPPVPLYQTATTYQGQPISISLKSSSNPANGVIEYKINSNPNQGKITNFNKNTGQLTYTPNQNAKNFDSFTFSVAYGGQGSGNYQPSSNVATAQPSIIK